MGGNPEAVLYGSMISSKLATGELASLVPLSHEEIRIVLRTASDEAKRVGIKKS